MRFLATGFTVAFGLLASAAPALADSAPYTSAAPLQLADHEGERDEAVTREEIRQKKRELERMERELREKERAERAAREDTHDEEQTHQRRGVRRHAPVRMWVGVGAGVGYGAVEVPCQPSTFGDDCREEGILNTYSANVTLAGPAGALRLRGIRDADKGDDARTPYEQAALLGTRFGRSNWYGFAGYGRVRHVDDRYPKDRAGGFAWEIVFAPSSESLTGLELGFQGNSGDDVDLVAFNIGMRFGALR